MSAPCFTCEGKKSAGIHLKYHPEYHAYLDPTRAGIKPVSDGRAAFNASTTHRDAYDLRESYCVGHALPTPYKAPGRCDTPLTPHHTLETSFAGKEYSEKHHPVVTLCAWLNDAIGSNPEVEAWALRTHFVRGGVSYPFLVSKKEAAR